MQSLESEDVLFEWSRLIYEAVSSEDVTFEANEAIADAILLNVELLRPRTKRGQFGSKD